MVSFIFNKLALTETDLTHKIVGAAIEAHRQLGPGLLESAYEECLAREFFLRSIRFERQKPIPIDLLVERRIVVELKSIEAIALVHEAVMLIYLKLSGNTFGLLVNFHVPVLKDGIRRYIWREKKRLNTEAAEVHRENGEFVSIPHDGKENSCFNRKARP